MLSTSSSITEVNPEGIMRREENYFEKLIELMDVLRDPGGCPWDREQTRETLKPMLIEEAHEVLDALDSDDPDNLCEELGDLLFQILFHCKIADERQEFNIHDVCRRVYKKMVRRHPHVFGDRQIADSQELLRNWEELKAAEKAQAGRPVKKDKSLLDGIPKSLPALYTAYQITSKAARVGFDWPELEGIREKFLEEFEELLEALRESNDEHVKEEVGDLVFVGLNIARYLQIDPETALNRANLKFVARFQAMERAFAENGRSLKDASLEEMENVWQSQKKTKESGKGAVGDSPETDQS
jgi:tetrapyrrole methylase family protein/MazG family protein